MNVNTGEIREFSQDELIKSFNEWIPVEKKKMTEKQKVKKRVSLKDHKSKLGMQLTKKRNEPCFCGSGEKFKFCCRNKSN